MYLKQDWRPTRGYIFMNETHVEAILEEKHPAVCQLVSSHYMSLRTHLWKEGEIRSGEVDEIVPLVIPLDHGANAEDSGQSDGVAAPGDIQRRNQHPTLGWPIEVCVFCQSWPSSCFGWWY